MVRKEDLCDWFQNLHPRKRLDYMCGLLHMCLPLELRFIGTVLEDLAKKDFHYLRDQEIKSNQPSDLSSNNSNDLADAQLRAKILNALALLNSTNSACAEIIFNILEHHFDSLYELLLNRDVAEEINLILTMAVHHPAFKFYQKTRLGDVLKLAEGHTRRLFGDGEEPNLSLPGNPGGPEMTCQPSSQTSASPQPQKVTVKSIEVVGAKPEPQNKRGGTEYQIHTTWSNGEVTEVFLKFKNLQELHHKVLYKNPEEKKNHTIVPVFPGRHKHLSESLEDQITSLNTYLSQLVKAPAHMLEIISEPLRNGKLVVPPANPVPAPVTAVPSIPMIANTLQQPHPIFNQSNASRGERFGDLSSIPRQGFILCPGAYPGQFTPGIGLPGHAQLSSTPNSPANSRTSSPSPHPSQVGGRSNFPHPSIYKQVSMAAPQDLQLCQLLRVLDLDQYYDNLKEFSVKQMFSMSKEDFAEAGLPVEAQAKLRSHLDQIKRSPPEVNGVDYPINRTPSGEVSQAYTYFYPYPSPPAFPVAYFAPTSLAPLQPSPHSHIPGGEPSPANSEASSPPPSPLLAQMGALSMEHGQGHPVIHGPPGVGPPLSMMSPPAAVAADSLTVSDVKLLKKAKGQHVDSSGSEEDRATGQSFEQGPGKVKGHGRAQHSQSLPVINPAAVSALEEAKISVMSAPPPSHPALVNSDARRDGTPPPHTFPVPLAAPPSQMSNSPGTVVNGYISDPPPLPPSALPRTMLSPRPFKTAQPTHTGPGIPKNVIPAFDMSLPPHNLAKNGGVTPIIHGNLPIHPFMTPPNVSTIPSTQVMGVPPASLQTNNTLHLGPQPPPPPSLLTEGGTVYSSYPTMFARGILTTNANSTAIMTTTQSHSVMPPLSHSPSPVATAVCADPAAPFIPEVVDANRPDGPSLTPPSHTPPNISAFKSQTNTSGPNSGTPSPPLVSTGPKQPGTAEAFAGRCQQVIYIPSNANGFLPRHFYPHHQQGHQSQQQHFPNGIASDWIHHGPRFPAGLPTGQLLPFLYGNSVYPPHNPTNSANTIPTCVASTPATNQTQSSGVTSNKTACYNCGQAGHKGAECKENTMENMSNPFRLNISKPKSDSE